MAKDVADISGRLAIPRYTTRAFDCTWTGIVGRDSEVTCLNLEGTYLRSNWNSNAP